MVRNVGGGCESHCMEGDRIILEHSVGAFAAEWAASVGAFTNPGDVSAAATTMTDDGVLRSAAALLQAQRALDVYKVSIAGEVTARSDAARGVEGMARRAGHGRPAHFLAELWSVSVAEAFRLCDVGRAIRPRMALDGTPLPAKYPTMHACVIEGVIGVDSAAVIVKELEAAAPRCSTENLLMAERGLVERAGEFTVAEMRCLARQVRDRMDQDGAEPPDALRHGKRSLRLFERRDGMVSLQWEMTPQTGGLVKAAIDAIVGGELRQARDERKGRSPAETCGIDDAPLGDDPRTLEQLRADAAEQVFRHAATCSSAGGDLPSITMVIRISLESLLTGLGVAEIDGIGETISASTARMMAADAQLMPMVLGGDGGVLDYGKFRRLFSAAQRIAFGERDGGCAWGGCETPPSYTEAHHIDWWSHSHNSDLSNGILLCSFHHHRVHDDGWQISFTAGVPYFIPPPWVDPGRTPRRGGRVRMRTPAAA